MLINDRKKVWPEFRIAPAIGWSLKRRIFQSPWWREPRTNMMPVDKRRERSVVVIEIIFQVCVLDHHDVPGRRLQAFGTAWPFPRGRRLQQQLDVRMSLVVSDQLTASVGRIAFDDDDFLAHAGQLLGQQGTHHFVERRSLIVHGHDGSTRPYSGRSGGRGCGDDGGTGRKSKFSPPKRPRRQPTNSLQAAQPRRSLRALSRSLDQDEILVSCARLKVPISMISLPGVLAAAACANTPSSLSRTLPLRFCVSTR